MTTTMREPLDQGHLAIRIVFLLLLIVVTGWMFLGCQIATPRNPYYTRPEISKASETYGVIHLHVQDGLFTVWAEGTSGAHIRLNSFSEE